LKRAALYQQTSTFIQTLQDSGNYGQIHITGHSLGGGISLVSGAQTDVPAVAISGPNLMLSRRTFIPEVSVNSINNYVLNVIPDRDLVPRIDDPGRLYQKIACRAKNNTLFGCHDSIRSLCELQYQCGSQQRFTLCDCATRYGYPPPTQIGGNLTFTDFCGPTRSNDGFHADVVPPSGK